MQREILKTMADMAGIEQKEIELGTDGCGFPVFSLPLSALSNAYLKLACPDLIEDEPTRSAVETITSAMNDQPLMVGGTGRVDSVLLEDSNIVAKGGFKGVFGFALKRKGSGSLLKCSTDLKMNGHGLLNQSLSRLDIPIGQPLNDWRKCSLLRFAMMPEIWWDMPIVNSCFTHLKKAYNHKLGA